MNDSEGFNRFWEAFSETLKGDLTEEWKQTIKECCYLAFISGIAWADGEGGTQ